MPYGSEDRIDFRLAIHVFFKCFYSQNEVIFFEVQKIELFSKNCLRLACTSLKSVEVPPDPPPERGFLGGVVLFALISFKIVQFFSEKLKNVANTLKNLWKKFGDHI